MNIRDVSLALEEREIFALLGPTGAGKTLLLESAAGFYAPEQGTVRLYGTPVQDIPLEERNIGFVYQDYALFPHMTVEDNIAYGLRVRRVPRTKQNALTRELAGLLGIRHVLKDYPQTLSGGEQQRTALARALILKPRLLLLDEPFSALDESAKNKLYGEVAALPERFGCAVFFVTHNIREAQRLALRIGVMEKGRLTGIRPAGAALTETEEDA